MNSGMVIVMFFMMLMQFLMGMFMIHITEIINTGIVMAIGNKR